MSRKTSAFALLVVLLAACRTPPAPGPAASGEGHTRWPKESRAGRTLAELCDGDPYDDACLEATPAEVSCPARREDVPLGTVCGMAGRTKAPACDYGDTRCRCATAALGCRGVAPTPYESMAMSWQCRPLPKPGDCPEDRPAKGSSCAVADQRCHVRGCGESYDCTCTASGWECVTTWEGGPPP